MEAQPGGVVVAVPVDGPDVGRRWGKAERVAVALVLDGDIVGWVETAVGWDRSHDDGTEGHHHAEVARFLSENSVTTVAVDHVGEGMARMLSTMGIVLVTDAHGPARGAVLAAAAAARAEG